MRSCLNSWDSITYKVVGPIRIYPIPDSLRHRVSYPFALDVTQSTATNRSVTAANRLRQKSGRRQLFPYFIGRETIYKSRRQRPLTKMAETALRIKKGTHQRAVFSPLNIGCRSFPLLERRTGLWIKKDNWSSRIYRPGGPRSNCSGFRFAKETDIFPIRLERQSSADAGLPAVQENSRWQKQLRKSLFEFFPTSHRSLILQLLNSCNS